MLLTLPWMTTSTFSEYRTCVRHVSRFAGQKDGRGRCASISSMVEPVGIVIFAQLTPRGTKMYLEGNVPSTT